jgi:hypothetical protein
VSSELEWVKHFLQLAFMNLQLRHVRAVHVHALA